MEVKLPALSEGTSDRQIDRLVDRRAYREVSLPIIEGVVATKKMQFQVKILVLISWSDKAAL